jgi:cAMP-dependent protein kinase regulator
MSLPSDYTNEINALNREILKHNPHDILQFCANFFQRRLESQRAEFLLSQRHSSQSGMAELNNPFGAPSQQPATQQQVGMHSVAEEEEHDFASPTAHSFPPNVHDMTPSTAPVLPGGNFGNFGFGANRSNPSQSPSAPPPGANTDPQPLPNNYNMNRRTSVSAESLAPTGSDDSNWKAPTYPKTEDQIARLREAVAHNFLFNHLDDDQSAQVLGALQERKVPAKDVRVIQQGDAGDYFYVVESGLFHIYVSETGQAEPGPDGMGTRVAKSGPGTSFGELALMYNAPRAATVVSVEPSILWQLDRITFRRILMDSAFQRRRMYENFLKSVPLLSDLTSYDRSKIADALETVKYPAGSTIIKEGDVGDKFYMLEEGEVEATIRGQPVKHYKAGDYFGELALLEDRPRAATIVSKTEVKLAMLGKDGFQRLLGPVAGVMRRDDPRKLEGNVDPMSQT